MTFEIHDTAIIGGDPQHIGQGPDPRGKVEIGKGTRIRAHVTIDRPLNKLTSVGQDCYLMYNAHVAHDCRVGDQVILCNNVVLGGHVHVGKGSYLGFGVVVHPWVTIGACAMIGAGTPVVHDVPPFTVVYGNPARWYRVNTVGLERAGKAWMIPFVREAYSDSREYWETHPKVTPYMKQYKSVRGRGDRKETKFGGHINPDLTYQLPSEVKR